MPPNGFPVMARGRVVSAAAGYVVDARSTLEHEESISMLSKLKEIFVR